MKLLSSVLKSKIAVLSLLFIFSMTLRIWNLNEAGRTWDEPAYAEPGGKIIKLIVNGDFNNNFLYTYLDHPPLARYFYGIASQFDIDHFTSNGDPVFKYDYAFSRLTSSFIFSLSVVLVTLIGWQYVSMLAGVTSGIILAMMPFSLGLSQLATLESFIIFFFTLSVYTYLKFLEKFSLRRMIMAGVALGLAMEVKESNILLYPLLLLLFVIWFIHRKKFNIRSTLIAIKKIIHNKFDKLKIAKIFILGYRQLFKERKLLSSSFKKITIVYLISVITFLFFHPFLMLHIPDWIKYLNGFWLKKGMLPVPEVFFGRMMLVPNIYYIVYFIITTPFIILILFFIGMLFIDKSKKWQHYAVFIWFAFPFIQSFYNFRQNGLRYIIEIYAPLSLIAGFGLVYVLKRFSKKVKIASVFLLVLYLAVILLRIQPYYLNYFNIIPGGINGVYKMRSFHIGWWGDGQKETARYLTENAPKGSRIGIQVNPSHVVEKLEGLHYELFNSSYSYDYIIVNYYSVLRQGFNEDILNNDYKVVYIVKADEVPLVKIFKRK